VRIIQKSSPYYRLPLEIGIKTDTGTAIHRIEVQGESTTFRISVDSKPGAVVLDPEDKTLFRETQDETRILFSEAVDIFTSRSNYETVIAKLEELLDECPDDMVARAWLGFNSHRFLQDNDKAITNLRYVVDNTPPHGEYELYYSRSCLLLGNLYDLKGRREQAVECYRKVLEHDRTKRFDLLAREYLEKPFTDLISCFIPESQ